jgi:hypothetical protein
VEAWVRRPGDLVVRPEGRPEEYIHGVPYSSSRRTLTSSPAGMVVQPDTEDPSRADPAPVFRSDGLVAQRPADWYLEHSDPMYENYTWTAMLDPEELSEGVDLDDLWTDELHGREVWWSRLRPVEGYEPRCGCCPLLWSLVAARAEYGDDPERMARFSAEGYPAAHHVALDVQTGIVVALEPIGSAAAREFSVQIHAVDADLDGVFAGRSATG